ncbi:MAG: 3-oxoacyl-ACP synthase [Bacteroidia bacterium]
MDKEKGLLLKQDLLFAASQALEERIKAAEKAMRSAQESANSEEKSSAGDKYETGRAMSQLERDMNAKQLLMAQNELKALQSIKTDVKTTAKSGALVKTSQNYYFICIGLGTFESNNIKVHLVSPLSPIGKAMEGLGIGDDFIFNGQSQLIEFVV